MGGAIRWTDCRNPDLTVPSRSSLAGLGQAGSAQGARAGLASWDPGLPPDPHPWPGTQGPLSVRDISLGLQSCFRTLHNYDFNLPGNDEHF